METEIKISKEQKFVDDEPQQPRWFIVIPRDNTPHFLTSDFSGYLSALQIKEVIKKFSEIKLD